MTECIFCKIVAGEMPSHQIWENKKHLAFLDIFPNTEGFSLVVTKEHHPSDPLRLDEKIYCDLMEAARQGGDVLVKAFDDVARVGIMVEGTGVDHAHVKLFPMHGAAESDRGKNKVVETRFFEKYPGYISSHTSDRADDSELSKLADKISGLNQKSKVKI